MKRNTKVLGALLLTGLLAAGCVGADPGAPPSGQAPLDPARSDCLAELAAGHDVIPGRFIVSFREDRLPALAADREVAVAAALGGRKSVFEIGVANAVAVDLSDAEVERLRADPRVAYVEPDGLVCALDEAGTEDEAQARKPPPPPPPPCADDAAQTTPAGLLEIRATERVSSGAGITVAIVDTGIDFSHPDLAGRILVADSTGFIDNTTGEDNDGHGTHLAGTIAAADNDIGVIGVAPGADLLSVKVLDSRGSGSWSTVAAGIDYAVSHGANVINLSLGGNSGSATLQTAIENARAAGVFVAVAAGNEGRTATKSYPAAYDDSVITVSAEDASTDGFASWSNYGVPPIDLAAPGVDVCSTMMGGGYGLMSGTSMSTPHVAAAAALLLEGAPETDPFVARDALVSALTPLADTRRHTEDLLNVSGL